jgi:branched-chain amino acid transport system substrate-binding protein
LSHKTSLRLFAGIAVLVLVGVACSNNKSTPSSGGTTGGGGAKKINVDVWMQGAWTGSFSSLTLPSFQSGEIHFNELNSDPTFPAHITVKQGDTQGSSSKAPPVVQQVVSDDNTVAVFGPDFSGESLVSGDTYNSDHIPFVTPSATSVELAGKHWDYWYRTVGNDDAQGRLLSKFIVKYVHPKRLFLLDDKSTYGHPLALAVEREAKAAGINVVGAEGAHESALNTGSTVNFSSEISDVKAANPDVVFFGGYFPDTGPFLKQARDQGLKFTLVSGDGTLSSDFVSLAGSSNANGTLITAPSNINSSFVKKYNQEEGSSALSIAVYSAEGYDVAGLIGAGIKYAIQHGDKDAKTIRVGIKQYLDTLTGGNTYHGVAKDVAFVPSTHELSTAADDLYYFYKVENGTVVNLGNASKVLG